MSKAPRQIGSNDGPEGTVAAGVRAAVIGPYLAAAQGGVSQRSSQARLAEASGLALAIDLDIQLAEVAPLRQIKPGTYIGAGKVDEIKAKAEERDISLLVMDCALSPIQQRNLERALGLKVIDRTGLILEIFGRRAQSREGRLQVEHAHLAYQKSRLVRSWTHLERQRGGFGFLGGPGETQIEADRRMLQERMKRIERELEGVVKTRTLHRASRDKVPYATVALVGYTNAGKSTLFNRLTRAEVLAKDMLFATLDPTARLIRLPGGLKAILSDTVGFISDLPTQLVAAFRATLEDVITADVILHVRDIADPETEAQAADVLAILADLGIAGADMGRVIEVWNKADLLPEPERDRIRNVTAIQSGAGRAVLVSAVTGDGVDALAHEIERRLTLDQSAFAVTLPLGDGQSIAWLHDNATVMDRREDGEKAHFVLRVPQDRERRLLSLPNLTARKLARS